MPAESMTTTFNSVGTTMLTAPKARNLSYLFVCFNFRWRRSGIEIQIATVFALATKNSHRYFVPSTSTTLEHATFVLRGHASMLSCVTAIFLGGETLVICLTCESIIMIGRTMVITVAEQPKNTTIQEEQDKYSQMLQHTHCGI